KASTVAWGLVKWGKWVWIVVVHSVTRGWQDIVFLLGCMGYTTSHTMPDGGVFCHSAMLWRCYLLKNLPQKAAPHRMAWRGQRAWPAGPVAEAKTARGGDAGHAQTSRAWEPHGARTGWAVWLRGPDHMGVGAGLGAGSRLGSPRGSRGVAGALAGQRARVAAGGVARAAADASPGDCAGEHTSGQAGSFDQ